MAVRGVSFNLFAQAGLQALAGLDDRIELLGDRLIEALLDLGAGAGSARQPSDRDRL